MNITVITAQTIVWGMTFHKRSIDNGKGGIMQISLRDGVVVWAVIGAFFCSITMYIYLVKALTHSTFSRLFMTLVSVIVSATAFMKCPITIGCYIGL